MGIQEEQLLKQLDRIQKDIELQKKILDENELDPMSHNRISVIMRMKGDHESAKKHIDKDLSLNSISASKYKKRNYQIIMKNKGVLNFKLEKYYSALEA